MPQMEEITTVSQEKRDVINQIANEVRGEPPIAPQEAPQEPAAEEAVETPEQPVDNQDAETAEEAPVGDEPTEGDDDAKPKRKSRAQDRIRQLVDEKKALESQIQDLEQYRPYLEQLAQEQAQQQPESNFQEYESQEEFFQAVKEAAKAEALNEINNELSPLKHNYQNTKYLNNIDGWFQSNPEAQAVRGQMEDVSLEFSDAERGFYENQILEGNTRVLDMLYASAKPAPVAKPDNSKAVKQAIKADQASASTASSKKATKSTEGLSSATDDLMNARKKGSFKDYLARHVIKREQ